MSSGAGRTKRSPTKAKARNSATKDPKGGLTAAGRREFAREQGSRLKPGVKKAARRMTAEEMEYRYRPAGSSEWKSLGVYNFMTREGMNPYAICSVIRRG